MRSSPLVFSLEAMKLPKMYHRMLSKFNGRVVFPQTYRSVYHPTKNMIRIANIFLDDAIPHEIAHMVQIKSFDRCLKDEWGMLDGDSFRKKAKLSPKYFFKSFVNEIKVNAITKKLFEADKYLSRKIDLNYRWRVAASKFLPFGRFENKKQVEDWSNDLEQKTYRDYSFERIEYEWDTKVEFLCNWMETK